MKDASPISVARSRRRTERPRLRQGRHLIMLAAVLGATACGSDVRAEAYIPNSDSAVLAELPAGTHHSDLSARRTDRIEVAIPLAQFYIRQSRLSGDLRYLGYAQATLAPWVSRSPAIADALVLQATVEQSRHDFDTSLATLERALAAKPDDPQALLTQATVLRVLGRYSEAIAACDRFSRLVEPGLGTLCTESLRGLDGHLDSAYTALMQLSPRGWLASERSWLYSELGEMAVRLGRDTDAQRWFEQDLSLAPTDFYVRAAYADSFLRLGRPADALGLLHGHESFEPLLLRIAIAQHRLRDPGLAQSRARLQAAFAAEEQRGEAVHRREQARFLLEVEDQPAAALAVALENWAVQREPDDVLVLVSAAKAAGNPAAARPALDFVRAHGQSDARVDMLSSAWTPSR
jgi:tetratricopeptide (TPR) repeat protein